MENLDFQVFNRFSDMMRQLYAKMSVPSEKKLTVLQMGYIHYLYDHEGCSQQDFVDMFIASKATISETLGLMESDGLIYRERQKSDRRVNKVFLTEQGRQVARIIRQKYDEFCEDALRNFTDREKEQMLDLLNRFMKDSRPDQ